MKISGGFAFLPFLWLVNIFWFFREAFLAPAYTEQSQIKGYVWRSAVGFLFWVIVLTTWITIFQIYRPRWGALGDYLSFTIPLGTPLQPHKLASWRSVLSPRMGFSALSFFSNPEDCPPFPICPNK
ncbi:gamma-secretase subunit PEN-2 isoform X2 [Alexandromys fortis]|uniref:gamma-secretase subunit PEN-2 isoform X2 n=2 Tax=Arvicolinae TaxID=39087 RepID=UPI0021533708|nr:gamma-secretase subunit PEN-2 isoform X2 [Microtus fortis]